MYHTNIYITFNSSKIYGYDLKLSLCIELESICNRTAYDNTLLSLNVLIIVNIICLTYPYIQILYNRRKQSVIKYFISFQIERTQKGILFERHVSCFCKKPNRCACYNPLWFQFNLEVNNTTTIQQTEFDQSLKGKWCVHVVAYDMMETPIR